MKERRHDFMKQITGSDLPDGSILLFTSDDLEWLFSTHLKDVDCAPFTRFSTGCAAYFGNEDCPDAIYLSASNKYLLVDKFFKVV